MKQFTVFGHTEVIVSVIVEVEDDEGVQEAIEKAYDEFTGIDQYAGNGSTDALIGVDGYMGESISANDEVVFDDAMEGEL